MENTGCEAGRWPESPGLGVMFMAGLPPIRHGSGLRLIQGRPFAGMTGGQPQRRLKNAEQSQLWAAASKDKSFIRRSI